MLASLKNLTDMDFLSMFSPQRQLLGLDIGSSSIKLVQIKEHRGRYTLQKFGVKELEPEVIVDGTVMDEGRVVSAIKELLAEQNVKLKQVAVSISGHAVDFYVLPPSENPDEQGEMSIVLVAAKKDKVNELTELVKAAGLVPIVMDVDAFAVENMYGVTSPGTQDDTTILVNIGASVMNVNIVGGGVSLFTRDIPLGGNRYSEAVQREMGVSYEEAEQLKKSDGDDDHTLAAVMESVNAEVASEIARTIDYFKTTSSDNEIARVLLFGGGAKVKGLAQQLRDRMHVEVDIANPFNEIDTSQCNVDPEQLAEMGPLAAVGVGLALRTVGDR